MPKRKTQFINNEIYHIILRSVGDTPIFIDESDHFRAVFSIYEFNNSKKVDIRRRRKQRKTEKKLENNDNGRSVVIVPVRDMYVEILVFAIMSNHIHLLVRQLKENGISNFMQKFGGLAWYFNKKYSRKGHLFCTFHSVHIASNEQLRNVFIYIHCNPISLIESDWKENRIKKPRKTIEFLNNYKWSSYRDYIDIQNFSSVTKRNFLQEFLGGANSCKNLVEEWIKYKSRNCKFDFDEVDIE
ncbi:MAG: hypothetical protein A2360_04215 [Candidatus Staskawiczbacteria bacterium RIFOXYB1_FULL_32_11]|uniref:Transposase IS200-like domain-containing protein n=1 Tax=Candidatus Staskawiczbacteria bacterium RIFOXYD1_FULL_32_13 TaxID=1802234 RepID=A0A1G2JLI6_9BACT|nr:MAG: Transposase IS200-family protein [Parcubacteria group bacterium GW2011_GWC2_32_10]OGZ78472.1 MAG: hypothetical protein A2360_04215 [Candidatus Staskawiczbacteria bacterium RIFOXYB1_FULL_32_11]OGZ79334.1 MAG: hypothetical protein A2256_00770 [Candidatus Staskawiczbacteria bacterium RIFOXYA2_FULL_32_7]OGZ85856.1 MAG: hypothetical protein A2463_03180 [Candidatus Staskawiczbacteria bacterium RIFOXYC2_FULL_32_10]OGZ88007.1 MAG: hypothetical protein A2561_02870 [Candidatus Staskawiczbacteria 